MELTRRGFTTLAAAAVAGAVAACTGPTPSDVASPAGTPSPGTDPGTSPGTAPATGTDSPAAPPGGGGSFTYWSMWQEGEDQQKVLADEIAKFTAATGIAVDVQWSGREVLTQVVPRLNAGNPPDLVDNGAPDFASRVGLENMMDLTDLYDMEIPGEEGTKVSDVVPEALMASMQKEGGEPFVVPYEITGATVFYNAKLTPQFQEKTPATWEEFIAILDELKAAGRTPLALDGDIADYCGYWVEWGVLRAAGPGAIVAAAQDASGESFKNPAWVAATDAVEQLVSGGYFPEGFRGTKFPTQQASWADQSSKTDVILMGTWLPSETTSSLEKSGGDPASIEFGSFPFPSIGENQGEGLVVAQPLGFGIPEKARNADAAKQFVAWFMQKDRIARIASEAKNLTPRTDVEPPAELTGYFEEYKNATSTVLFTDGVSAAEPKWVTDIWQPALGELFDGKLTAEQFRQQLADKTAQYHG